MSAKVIMAKNPSWRVYKPWIGEVDTTGSLTDGLQEAMNYAAANGFDLEVVGGPLIGQSDIDNYVISCSERIRTPPLHRADWRIGSVTIDFADGVTYGFSIDSMWHSTLEINGRIMGSGACQAVLSFAPSTPLSWPQPLFVDNKVSVQRVIVWEATGYPAGVLFSPISGTIARNDISIIEIEGGDGQISWMGNGVEVWTPQNGWSFVDNEVRVKALLQHSATGLHVGKNGYPANGVLSRNTWDCSIVSPMLSGCTGITTSSRRDFYSGTIVGNATSGPGVILESSAEKCKFLLKENSGNPPVVDQSLAHDCVFI